MTDKTLRRFTRIPFDASCKVRGPEDQTLTTQVMDLSLKGVLIQTPTDWRGKHGDIYMVDIILAPDTHITMETRLVHQEGEHAGFKCEHIDLDSITHLRRVMELNTGSEELLDREIAEMLGLKT